MARLKASLPSMLKITGRPKYPTLAVPELKVLMGDSWFFGDLKRKIVDIRQAREKKPRGKSKSLLLSCRVLIP